MKIKVKRPQEPEVYDISITTDTDYPDKVEIHLLNQQGAIIEGGQFDLKEFLDHVMAFYNENY
jgi:hypothetical protein